MKIKSVEEIKEFLTEYAKMAEVEIAEIEFKQGKNPALTIFIDKEGGIDLDSCERFHNLINDPLDKLDPTFGEVYTLNVSSLGADRPYKTEKDFLSHIGKRVEVRLKTSVAGKKFYDGELLSYDGRSAVIKINSKDTFTFDMKNIVKMNDYIDFE